MAEYQPLIIYGTGDMGYYYDEKCPTKDKNGVTVVPILVAPSEELLKRYGGKKKEELPLRMEDGRYGIWKEYPPHKICWPIKGGPQAIVIIACGFDGEDSPLMQTLGTAALHRIIELNDQEINTLRMAVAVKQREKEDVLINEAEVARKRKMLEEVNSGVESAADEETGGE